ncbi:MAG TPA: DinB family protein [Sediminibacterium sp.]|uniref:DinB family protein n=1 Tax=Sediminibacterium sp. TaxID=1917865 RepID=UPI0008BA3F11|nr:DinB family protein [Sediminibacterium sp.]OHC86419.1 MAG: hypothetical protein A2472_02280 [Sphingobacteriia bacterium RIFOXYC2_FULL_35_18]OHC89932.1 MAG: hypothetical protein A2546_11530 [Sphingobacteriia bacterium RIFOXYD2_FULL_35_12]HLD54160.1 DinB family protein [Sediminibacterium sp.]
MLNTKEFLKSLTSQLSQIELTFAAEIANANEDSLNAIPNYGGWSILQVLDHLNFYNRWYLPKIEAAIKKSLMQKKSIPEFYKSGWLGAYFIKMMQPKLNGSLASKMEAPKNAIPATILNAELVLNEFSAHLVHLNRLLDLAINADINNTRVVTSLSSWISLKTGDSMAFLLAHMERHFLQIMRIKKSIPHKYVMSELETQSF